MWQPYGDVSDIPEIKIRSSIQNRSLQAGGTGGQDAVEPDADLLGQSHVNDDRQNAEEQSCCQAWRHRFEPR